LSDLEAFAEIKRLCEWHGDKTKSQVLEIIKELCEDQLDDENSPVLLSSS
jgi:hypothetical protein